MRLSSTVIVFQLACLQMLGQWLTFAFSLLGGERAVSGLKRTVSAAMLKVLPQDTVDKIWGGNESPKEERPGARMGLLGYLSMKWARHDASSHVPPPVPRVQPTVEEVQEFVASLKQASLPSPTDKVRPVDASRRLVTGFDDDFNPRNSAAQRGRKQHHDFNPLLYTGRKHHSSHMLLE